MLKSWDDRRDLYVAKDTPAAIDFAVENWIHSAQRAILQRGRFTVALSGGSTPKAIYEKLLHAKLDWSKVWLFWGDERSVPPTHSDSNYKMAMDAAFSRLPIPPSQIFRMVAEKDIEKNALDYEDKIRRHLDKHYFDLVMLGIGEDGHTASLFPNTEALTIEDRLVVANHIPDKNTWRMTLTYPCINQSTRAIIYALGSSKAQIVPQALNSAIVSPYPSSKIGTPEHKALWILDTAAARLFPSGN